MSMAPADLSLLLDETNHHPWESVASALGKSVTVRHPRREWLIQHLLDTKREYWRLVAEATETSPPPQTELPEFMTWEVTAARQLTPADLQKPIQYGELPFTVASLLRLNIRHTTWHAGQLAALDGR